MPRVLISIFSHQTTKHVIHTIHGKYFRTDIGLLIMHAGHPRLSFSLKSKPDNVMASVRVNEDVVAIIVAFTSDY